VSALAISAPLPRARATRREQNAGFPVAGLTDPNPADGSAFGKAPNNAGTLVPAILPSNRSTAQGLLLMTQYPKPTLSDPCANLNWTASLNTQRLGAKKMPVATSSDQEPHLDAEIHPGCLDPWDTFCRLWLGSNPSVSSMNLGITWPHSRRQTDQDHWFETW